MTIAEFRALVRTRPGRHFLNHAATCPTTARAAAAMQRIITQGQSPLDEHRAEWVALLERTRCKTASLLGAHADEVAFVPSTSAGLSLVAAAIPWADGDVVLLPEGEFPSTRWVWSAVARAPGGPPPVREFAVPPGRSVAEALTDGAVDLAGVRVLALSHVCFRTGRVADLETIGRLCAERDIVLVVDGAQAVGAVPTDLAQAAGVAFYVAAAQKWLHGPLGAGFLVVRRDVLPSLRLPMAGWASAADAGDFAAGEYRPVDRAARFEPGLPDVTAIAGLEAALDALGDVGWPLVHEAVRERARAVRASCERRGFCLVEPDATLAQSGIVAFEAADPTEAEAVWSAFQRHGIAATRRDRYFRLAPHFHTDDAALAAVAGALDEVRRVRVARPDVAAEPVPAVSSSAAPATRTRALITGASRGLGAAVADELAREGSDLWLVARDAGRLRAVAARLSREHGVDVRVDAVDLADAAAVGRFVQELAAADAPINRFVHAAAAAHAEPALGAPDAHLRESLEVNFVSAARITQAILPGMRQLGRGTCCFVATSSARCALPLFAAYAGSKAALWSWAESLGRELAGTGIDVHVVVPPHMPTATRNALARTALGYYAPGGSDETVSPAVAAADLVRVLRTGGGGVSWRTRFTHALNAVAPGIVSRRVARRFGT